MGHQKSLFTKVRSHFLAKVKKPSWKVIFVVPAVLVVSVVALLLVTDKPTSAYPCPCHVFDAPTNQSDFNDGIGLELGFKFKSQIDGYITGVRFYKQGSMSGTHVGSLWKGDGSGGNLATATFISESGSGWQEVLFSSPVEVTANTLYVASVTMPDGRYIASPNYFLTDQSNYPLVAPSSSNAPGNGVYSTTPGVYPASNSGNASNYWIDVNFKATDNPTPPTVTAVTPTNGATNVLPGASLTATFDIAMNPDSFTSSSFIVKDDQNNTLGSTVSFDIPTGTATYVADAGFVTGKTYTATLKGGGGSAVQNIDGTPMAADYTWSFTISSTNSCPCSLKDRAAPIGSGTFDDLGGLELGTKIVPQTNGYITTLRFYKPITMPESTHDLHVWSSTGTSLAAVTTSDESDFGWQEARLNTPLHVLAGKVYIVSYTSPSAVYMSSANGLASTISNGYLTAYADGDSHNTATGSGARNGVFTLSPGAYPNSGTANFYWVDAVFSTDPTGVIKPSVDTAQPSDKSYGVPRSSKIQARLSRAMDGSTVTNSSAQLLDGNTVVSATASYDAATYTIKVTPGATLAYGKKYTVKLTSAITDTNGLAIDPYSWSFTTGSQLSTDPATGPGGPILVITSSGNHYSDYYAEMLRTEGLSYFDVKELASVSASTLGSYSQVILGQTALTQPQADMFTTWVQNGGDLIAMKPDSKLASLLGLTSNGTTHANGYLAVDTSKAPGAGIVSDTIQYKGTADDYALNGATEVATLYSDAATATSNPAVTYKAVGSKGGSAAAFTYDLAKAVIALHQGNQAWAGGDRDGDAVIRSNDLYFGAKAGDSQADWVDLNKIHIPQADEQQRLMVNILNEAAKDAQPLPRFWYLPHDYKAAMVLAGDDHGLANKDGTEKVLNKWLTSSPTSCSVADWQCVRASGYIYVSAGLTNARAAQFENAGFDLGAHPPGDGGGCNNYLSYAGLGASVAASLTDFHTKFVSLPNQRTTRYHCYVWSDWDSQPRVDLDNGIRYDLDYVTYPLSWVSTRPAVITGSAMNMRLTDAGGSMLDVHQGVTNFENTVSNSTSINAVLDNATGANGFYGIFGTHYDMSDSFDSTLYASAASRNVPMISADQALTWLDGHGSSSFSNFSGSYGKVSFTIAAAEGAIGLKAMMPVQDAGGTIASLKTGGTDVTYQTQTVKGVQYAVFDAIPGAYTVTYSDYTEPVSDDGGAGGVNPSQGSTTTTTKRGSTRTVFSDDTSGLDNAVGQEEQTPKPETQDQPDTNKDDEKTVIQADKSTSTSWWKRLLGLGVLALFAGILIGLAVRRRHQTPGW